MQHAGPGQVAQHRHVVGTLAGCVYRDLITVVRERDLQALRCLEQIHISCLGIVALHQIMSNWEPMEIVEI